VTLKSNLGMKPHLRGVERLTSKEAVTSLGNASVPIADLSRWARVGEYGVAEAVETERGEEEVKKRVMSIQ